MERLPWFPCEHTPLLSALGCMDKSEQHIYLIILLRIYESGGVCRDTIAALARRTRWPRRIVQQAIESLQGSGRLVVDGTGGMTNPKADKVLAKMQHVRETKSNNGFVGGKKTQQNQRSRQAAARFRLSNNTNTNNNKEREDNPPVVPPRGRAHRLPDDFKLSQEAVAYAGEHGLNASDLFAPFCDHHRAKGNAMVDWTAAWRTWVRNEVKFSKNRMNGNGHAPRPGSKEDSRERTQAALAAFAPNDGTYDCRTGPRSREPLFEIIPPTQLGKP
jgi:hypothetical protein